MSSQAKGWTGIDTFMAMFQPMQMLPVIPSLLLAPAFTALTVSVAALFNRIVRSGRK